MSPTHHHQAHGAAKWLPASGPAPPTTSEGAAANVFEYLAPISVHLAQRHAGAPRRQPAPPGQPPAEHQPAGAPAEQATIEAISWALVELASGRALWRRSALVGGDAMLAGALEQVSRAPGDSAHGKLWGEPAAGRTPETNRR